MNVLVRGFVEGSSMFDVTPVENMFISEYMLRAPGDYVKVYLFILNFCYYPHDEYTTNDMAKELGMDEDEVKKALIYWAQLSLIEIESRRPFSIRLKNIKQMLQNELPQKNDMYNNQDLIMQIQQSFGGRRLLNTSDTKKVLYWASELKWSPEMIALVVAWCIEGKGRWVHFSYIDKVITNMHESGIDNYAQAEKHLIISSAKASGASKLLQDWNEKRVATVDEIVMYNKWIEKWGMDKATVLEARKQTVGISGNKFKYLDGILSNWHKNDVHSVDESYEYMGNTDRAKEITKIIYNKTQYSEKTAKTYTKMKKMGYSHKVLLRTAIALKGEGLDNIDDMQEIVFKWNKAGVIDDETMMDKLDTLAKVSISTKDMLGAWGETRTPKLSFILLIFAGFVLLGLLSIAFIYGIFFSAFIDCFAAAIISS